MGEDSEKNNHGRITRAWEISFHKREAFRIIVKMIVLSVLNEELLNSTSFVCLQSRCFGSSLASLPVFISIYC